MKTISTPSDFDELLVADSAVVYLHAAWSASAVAVRSRLLAQEDDWRANAWAQGIGVTWWEIDVSSQQGEVWDRTRSWLSTEVTDAETLLWTGGGCLVWSRHGRVVDHAIRGDLVTSLADRTRGAFT